ncbi:MAG: hypothetical protein ABIX44_10375 [Cryobacterium sp.]
MNKREKTAIGASIVGSMILGGAIGGTFLTSATAATNTPTDSSTSEPTDGSDQNDHDGSDQNDHDGSPGHGETRLTGDTAAKVTAAVKEKYPDAVIKRVENDRDGVYEAHITQADGTRATVKLDTSFAITGTETGRGHGRPHGERGHDGGRDGEAPLTGDTAAKVTAAVTAKYPDAVIKRLENDRDENDSSGAAYEAHIRQADGTRATVKLDASFAITATETGHGHGGGDGHGDGDQD